MGAREDDVAVLWFPGVSSRDLLILGFGGAENNGEPV